MRSTLLDLTPIISATVCHQRNYVERYSRYRIRIPITLRNYLPFSKMGREDTLKTAPCAPWGNARHSTRGHTTEHEGALMAGARSACPHCAPTWFAAGRPAPRRRPQDQQELGAGKAVDLSRLSQSHTPFSQSEKVSDPPQRRPLGPPPGRPRSLGPPPPGGMKLAEKRARRSRTTRVAPEDV
jgi:hypothetical protein